jgi:phosphoenolpyruvate synthase/pyruvate phosphate dikinase
VGVKAANLGELSKLLPGHAPDGFAIPFSFYAGFLNSARLTPGLCDVTKNDCSKELRNAQLCTESASYRESFGQKNVTIQEFIDSLLINERFQSDSRFREASLDGLRYCIRHAPVDSVVAYKIDRFADSMFHGKRIRLRSSTNAEDLEDFNGAGLYSSTGADAGGIEKPSDEIRKVWASVWSWQAFEERSFRNIDHRKVFMGVAVHPAFTDEAANGVLITSNISDPGMDGFYVNVQPGEELVTNPQDGSLPEIFTIINSSIVRKRFSSLSPQIPVMSDSEIIALYEIASEVKNHFAPLYKKNPFDPLFALELEFKLNAGDRTVFIKQARPYDVK